MSAYYNENDPKTVLWLRELINRGLIAPGEVDDRSILDVRPDDLRGFTQCHFFAGIGVWSYALRLAGWPDDRPVWTGSCPCQPFSVAGKRKAHDDERHLWPSWFALVRECRPVAVFGEQVGGKTGLLWFDHVRADLETCDYAAGLASFGACDVGAPHIRQRIYFVAHAGFHEPGARRGNDGEVRGIPQMERGTKHGSDLPRGSSRTRALADSNGGNAGNRAVQRSGEQRLLAQSSEFSPLADAGCSSVRDWRPEVAGTARRSKSEADQRQRIRHDARDGGDAGIVGDAGERRRQRGQSVMVDGGESPQSERRAQTDGFAGPGISFWSDAEWLACTDGKARPAKPGIFPLAHGAPARVVRLRGYGNALCAPQAQAFIEAYLEINP